MLVDSHVHLNSPDFSADLQPVLQRARAAGVRRFLCPGYDLASSQAAVALAAAEPEVIAAVGIHPHDAQSCNAEVAREIESFLVTHRARAVGETGLDYYYDHSPRDVQQQALRLHLHLARRHDLPVVVHNRDSDADMARILAEDGAGLRLVLHAFGGSELLAALGAHHGFYFGIGGFLTFKKHPLAERVRDLPRSSLLLETDSPYLSPHPRRGQRNEPAHVEIVARRLGELLGLGVEEVGTLTTRNFERFLEGSSGGASPLP